MILLKKYDIMLLVGITNKSIRSNIVTNLLDVESIIINQTSNILICIAMKSRDENIRDIMKNKWNRLSNKKAKIAFCNANLICLKIKNKK